jgi:hypothetical protein
MSVNGNQLAVVPLALETLTGPEVASPGTVAVIWNGERIVKVRAGAPLKRTDVTPARLRPQIVTIWPTIALPGVARTTTGGGTMKDLALVAVPPGVVTATGPLLAATGTTALRRDGDSREKTAAGAPLKVTPLAPSRCAPMMTTVCPAIPA